MILLFWLLGYPLGAQAEEQSRILESSRALGRGNTFVAAFDSDEATRANPGTLSEEKLTFQLRWLQTDVFVGENTLDTASDFASLASGSSSSITGVLDTFADKFGKRQYMRGQFAPFAMRIYAFEFSPFISTRATADMRVPTTPEVNLNAESTTGVNIAYGTVVGKDLVAGITVRPMHRNLFSGEASFSSVLDFVDSSELTLTDLFVQEEGFQIGVDLGLIYKPSKENRFGLIVENLGYAGNFSEFKNPPPPMPSKIHLGWLSRTDFKPWHWDFLLDIHDVTNPEALDFLRLVHLGTELGTSYISRDHDIGALAGINEGYFTFGSFIDLWVTRLNFSYYAVELGEYAGQRKDRRWGLTLLSSMTF